MFVQNLVFTLVENPAELLKIKISDGRIVFFIVKTNNLKNSCRRLAFYFAKSQILTTGFENLS